jgi:antitoxin StbD
MTCFRFEPRAVNLTEFRKNPMRVLAAAKRKPVAVFKRNQPAFYCVPAFVYEEMLDRLEDIELNDLASSRSGQPLHHLSLADL